LAWAKPHVDEALADVARGDVMTLEEHEARTSPHHRSVGCHSRLSYESQSQQER
jgi:hypothetical protein